MVPLISSQNSEDINAKFYGQKWHVLTVDDGSLILIFCALDTEQAKSVKGLPILINITIVSINIKYYNNAKAHGAGCMV